MSINKQSRLKKQVQSRPLLVWVWRMANDAGNERWPGRITCRVHAADRFPFNVAGAFCELMLLDGWLVGWLRLIEGLKLYDECVIAGRRDIGFCVPPTLSGTDELNYGTYLPV